MSRLQDFRWKLHRQLFFFNQRAFYTLSYLLLDNMSSSRARGSLLRSFGAKVGQRCTVRGGLILPEGFNLSLGDDVFINASCCFDTAAEIIIEDRVQIAYQVTIITGGHDIGLHEGRAGRHKPEPVVIGEGAWIGARAVLLPGVKIGAGAVVAAGALVTKDVPSDTLVVGTPARVVKELDPA